MPENKWHNCYDEGWKDIIVPEAFSHPAKMAYGLLKRILTHIKEQGWGGVIVDPFGGIGSTGILGAYEGYQVVSVELERKFVDLADTNYELHMRKWHKLGCPQPLMLQGDSRQLCQIVEKADIIVSSPPFQESISVSNSSDFMAKIANQLGSNRFGRKINPDRKVEDYGQTPGQLGSMKPGKVDMVLSSPPYAEALSARGGRQMAQMGLGNAKAGKDDKCKDAIGYSNNPKNLGNLKSGDVDLVLSSPPYEGSIDSTDVKFRTEGLSQKAGKWAQNRSSKSITRLTGNYGNSEGQLGQEQGDTFWSAAKIITEQCFQILKPGGHAIWVVKSFVRKGKIVDFPGDWQRLCESVGFKTVCVHHAMLVKETKHQTLFGHTEIKRKERKSFFRRLAEAKGSPRIDFEVVLCMEAPK